MMITIIILILLIIQLVIILLILLTLQLPIILMMMIMLEFVVASMTRLRKTCSANWCSFHSCLGACDFCSSS